VFQHLIRHALRLEELLQRDRDTHGFLLSVAEATETLTVGREKAPRRAWGCDQRQPMATGPNPAAGEGYAIGSRPRVTISTKYDL
jgi:hypothetical protein